MPLRGIEKQGNGKLAKDFLNTDLKTKRQKTNPKRFFSQGVKELKRKAEEGTQKD